ncbi:MULTISPECIES: putative metalloprotease CJM1_0395 family protein [unclassified Shewanella]|uniref:putative metalloprotease CJM1_0395 family protein n=1 Tax=unclassified Shewanella TaxID=196818 RepID=UPI0021DAB567|nr:MULTISPECIES: putative metalloprotease CJM1_0395 family protein [unclassified Shewanella]MCU8003101.1 protein-glutamate methyltransferase [Shewanella sp. SM96]MCU8060903.1 protein-glutamate methyltransferase [Shewanella sp. SM55]MCU8069367.1 protein-glutamate methyltransferase [Shewanella sp. SM32]
MSVVALSPKVGAPSSSFSAHDKMLSSNLSQSHANSTYQGASAHTAGSAKIEASGVHELQVTGTSFAPVQATPITSLAANVSQSLHSSPNVSFAASSAVSSTTASVLPVLNGASQAPKIDPFSVPTPRSNPQVNTLNDRASLHADASFSLLTGPRSISGVRGGQIATPISTQVFSPVAGTSNSGLGVNSLATISPNLSVTSNIPVDIFTPLSPSIGTSGTDIPAFNPSSTGDVSPIMPDLAAVFGPQTVFTGAALVDPSTSDSVINSAVNKSIATSAGPVGQSNSAQALDQSASNDVAQPTVLEQFTQVFGEAQAQASPVDAPAAASNPDDSQQVLAAVFAPNDNQLEKQVQEEESQKQQIAAAEEAKQQSLVQQAQEQEIQAQEKAQAQQQQQVDSLKARDSEVKAHEHAHATVGGQYAQSPSFKYEKGADGQRYATDGEVQIDVSPVGGDPLATINKMKQVYAAAMAPVDPSSADIRVAAEALQKMNEAKVMLAEERQKQIVDLQTAQTLIDADAQIKELPPLEKHTPVVTGDVDESGNIVQPQEAVFTPASTALDKLKQAIEAQTANTRVIDTGSKTSSDISDSVTTSTTVETIEPPTATLAFGEASTSADLATGFISRSDSAASRYYAAVAQASAGPSSRVDMTSQANILPSYLASSNELPSNLQSTDVLSANNVNEQSSNISASANTNVSLQSELYVEDDLLQETGFIQPQYLGYQQARYVDFSV